MDQVWELQQQQRDQDGRWWWQHQNTTSSNHNNVVRDADEDSSMDEVVIVNEHGCAETTTALEKELKLSFDPSRDLNKTIYSRKTWTDLRNLRGSIFVDRTKIVDYLNDTLQDLVSVVPIETCLECIEAWHRQLLYVNPLQQQASYCPNDNQLRLALPPGIENLGATCYLNTQLQCLAQITVFLDGIFTWQPPPNDTANDDTMTTTTNNNNNSKLHKVLATFQRVLANLYVGSHRTITTVEFSNALELDHFEQQDPNEFSRLFLDLMHTAFQKEASASSASSSSSTHTHSNGSSNNNNNNTPHTHTTSPLPGLLPHLFQGTIQNSIICQNCSKHSTREEAFMDLNLPITTTTDDTKTSPSSSSNNGNGGTSKKRQSYQTSILESLGITSKKQDPDVQQFLNRYCQDEILNGDNQYHCEYCGGKQNAIRRVRFTKLPSLLNIQLSRYIFDMKTLSKKKVTDKVLLPRKLSVHVESTGGGEPSLSTEERTYLLCAVMIHKGKSAYSGHYVAQAMDWTTGTWFDFNDTEVKILKDGPDCSFHVENGKTTSKKLVGSQDAYNLYYVEEGFLAGSVMERMKELQGRFQSSSPVLEDRLKECADYFRGLDE
jgi:ubiquitin carboxyl-terminal hydrolase 48